ncbi:uncharacterized protein K452DRAFT_218062 [Aplosporella prunicola CBS 121167]|uniref:Ornithine decarboxylase antizyme n=1 Tax=Aplosporella prunicola CBS 121167 TaxID=1176127 RepID=A0A6A6BWS6_9PEZI|nr:uncharacterized protein K452DRAFT_218062 [Aplosporella prunicola CBS 121167]KAF2147171.1 hypothetical protein K452DRAFT_218062 [Aplosporella prunicola CBS 121167]
MKASCYAADARSMALQGFHYSTTGAGGADSGMPSPPESPPLAAYTVSDELTRTPKRGLGVARRGGAACTIAGESERLFCETLRTVFLGERNAVGQDSLAMGMYMDNDNDNHHVNDHYRTEHDAAAGKRIESSYDSGICMASPPISGGAVGAPEQLCGTVAQWIEVWDYVGGARFRGFVADDAERKAMFVFFDPEAVVRDLKPGLMALMELCSMPELDCESLNVCLDRGAEEEDMKALMKDLGWIGFEPITLAEWTDRPPVLSDRWLFLGMEV